VTGRRLLVLVLVLVAVGVPAGVLQAACVGRSCDGNEPSDREVPFCPLPQALKEQIVNGYREGRSPDLLGVADVTPVFTDVEGLRTSWPGIGSSATIGAPFVFFGAGVSKDASEIPIGVTLDRVAPTVSEILGFDRPFPEVRSGTPIEGVAGGGDPPRLVVLIAWKGVGSAELESRPNEWPFMSSLFAHGAGSIAARTGSLPLDPAATLTTIGTGGLPSQHGITGSFVRNDEGEVVPAFGPGVAFQVIATLADDLEDANPDTLVGLVATDARDRGIVGGGWYLGQDPVDVVIGDSAAAPLAVDVHLATGYGADDVPDVLGVVLEGGIRSMDARTRRIVTAAQRATEGSALVVVAGTGSRARGRLAEPDTPIVEAVEEAVPGDAEAVAAVVPGGLFMEQDALRQARVTGQVTVEAMRSAGSSTGETMLADAFQGFAVSFARYC
jgi:hypothetical protein